MLPVKLICPTTTLCETSSWLPAPVTTNAYCPMLEYRWFHVSVPLTLTLSSRYWLPTMDSVLPLSTKVVLS